MRIFMPHIQRSCHHIRHDRSVGNIETGAMQCFNVNTLAFILERFGEFNLAGELYQWVLDREEMSLRKDHPNILSTVRCMAGVFDDQGRYDEALEWYKRALAGQEKSLGKGHPDTLTTAYGMARVFHDKGSYDEALE